MQDRSRGTARWKIPRDLKVEHVNGYPLAYQEVGSGQPLVLVHGSLTDYRSWAHQIPALSRSFRVLALSLRHYYPEAWDGRGDDFSLAQHVADIVAFIEQKRLGMVHLLGHSRGGAVALLFAKRHSNLIASLILADPRGLEGLLPNTREGREMAANIRESFASLHRHFAAGDTETGVRTFVDALSGTGTWGARSDEDKQRLLDNLATSVDTGELPHITHSDVANFSFPLLLVKGDRSPARFAAGFNCMRSSNSAIEAPITIPAAGHNMHQDNPTSFNRAILHFLERTGASRF